MTDSRDFKRLVRARMAATGETYTVARAHFERPPARTGRALGATGLPASVASFKRKVYGRSRATELAVHLSNRYGIQISGVAKLDVGVYRVDRRQDPSWVARLFSSARTKEAALGDAEILERLATCAFPAERLAHPEAVSMLAGQPLLVTEFLPGENRRNDETEATMHALGDLLGRLHALPLDDGACGRPAGAWHHLSPNGGTRRDDIRVLLPLLHDARTRLPAGQHAMHDELCAALEDLDDLTDLPTSLVHPDPGGANLIAATGQPGVLVDWTGAGRGARVGSFANLAGGVGQLALIDALVEGYAAHIRLQDEELERLPRALVGFPLILDTWMFLFRRAPLDQLFRRLDIHRARADAIAARTRSALLTVRQGAVPPADANQPPLFDMHA